jgi:hypothetical protein
MAMPSRSQSYVHYHCARRFRDGQKVAPELSQHENLLWLHDVLDDREKKSRLRYLFCKKHARDNMRSINEMGSNHGVVDSPHRRGNQSAGFMQSHSVNETKRITVR